MLALVAQNLTAQVIYQTRWLIWRNWMVFSRNKIKTKTKTIVTFFMALLLGLICQHYMGASCLAQP